MGILAQIQIPSFYLRSSVLREQATKCLCFVQVLGFCSTPQLELCRPFLADFITKKSLIIMRSPEMWGNWMLKSSVGTGLVGAPACGDVMKLQIEVDENGKIIDAKFKTFGCGSAIASSSLATEWVKGKSLDDAGKIKNSDIAAELCLPPVKLHCSMLAEDAIKAALKDYKVKNEKKTEAVAGK